MHRHIVKVLTDDVIPFSPFTSENFILMHDNAHPYAAHCLRDIGIPTVDWLACNPDLYHIEHLWGMLGQSIPHRNFDPQNEMRVALQKWNLILQKTLQDLVISMA